MVTYNFTAEIRFNLFFEVLSEKLSFLNNMYGWSKEYKNIEIELLQNGNNNIKINCNNNIILSFPFSSFIDNSTIKEKRRFEGLGLRENARKNRIDFFIKPTKLIHSFFLENLNDDGEEVQFEFPSSDKEGLNKLKDKNPIEKFREFNILSISIQDNYETIVSDLKQKSTIKKKLQENNQYIKLIHYDVRQDFFMEYKNSALYGIGGVYAINKYRFILPLTYSNSKKKGGKIFKKTYKKKGKISKNKSRKTKRKNVLNKKLISL